MASRTRSPRARRSWLAVASLALGIPACLLAAWGCLNPRPDDYPSGSEFSDEAAPPPVPSATDDCSDTPLDLSCNEGSTPLVPGEEGDGVDADLDVDAGVDGGAADGGADADAGG